MFMAIVRIVHPYNCYPHTHTYTHTHTHTHRAPLTVRWLTASLGTQREMIFFSQDNPLPLSFTHTDTQTQTRWGEGTYCQVVLYLHSSFLILFLPFLYRLPTSTHSYTHNHHHHHHPDCSLVAPSQGWDPAHKSPLWPNQGDRQRGESGWRLLYVRQAMRNEIQLKWDTLERRD